MAKPTRPIVATSKPTKTIKKESKKAVEVPVKTVEKKGKTIPVAVSVAPIVPVVKTKVDSSDEKLEIDKLQKSLQDRKTDLEIKQSELKDIIAETEKEENELVNVSEENRNYIEDRLISAYTRIRKNARNGLAVVQIERDACGGCFNKIPPQHQLDIRMHKKIIVCEYCGRILVDDAIVNVVE